MSCSGQSAAFNEQQPQREGFAYGYGYGPAQSQCNCAQVARYAAPVAPMHYNPFQGACNAPLHRRAQACCQMSSHECYGDGEYHRLSVAYGR